MMKINTWLSSLSFPLYGTGLACPPTAAGKGVALEIVYVIVYFVNNLPFMRFPWKTL
jgi:hypothetical protein